MLILTRRVGEALFMGEDTSKPHTHSVAVAEIWHGKVRVRIENNGVGSQAWLEVGEGIEVCGGKVLLHSVTGTQCKLRCKHPREVDILRDEVYRQQGGFGGGK